MKRASLLALALAACSSYAFAARNAYTFVNPTGGAPYANWGHQWSLSGQHHRHGRGKLAWQSTDPNGTALISTKAVPDGSSNYDLEMDLSLPSSGGTYVMYLAASSNAYLAPSGSQGSYYAFEITPTIASGACSAVFTLWKRSSNILSSLATGAIPCHDGIAYHAVYAADNSLILYADQQLLFTNPPDVSPLTGQPGFGGRASGLPEVTGAAWENRSIRGQEI